MLIYHKKAFLSIIMMLFYCKGLGDWGHILIISQLAEKLNISSRAVEMQIRYLKKEGLLVRVGSRRNGWWEVSQSARKSKNNQ